MVCLEQGNATKKNLTQSVKLQVKLEDLLKETANYLVFTRGEWTGNLYYSLDNSKTPITEIQRGELVRVRLTVVIPAVVHYIVIDDPLPAGLEAIESTILTDTAVPMSYTLTDYEERGWGWWYSPIPNYAMKKWCFPLTICPQALTSTPTPPEPAPLGRSKSSQVIPPTASEFYFPDVGGRGAGSVFEVKP